MNINNLLNEYKSKLNFLFNSKKKHSINTGDEIPSLGAELEVSSTPTFDKKKIKMIGISAIASIFIVGGGLFGWHYYQSTQTVVDIKMPELKSELPKKVAPKPKKDGNVSTPMAENKDNQKPMENKIIADNKPIIDGTLPIVENKEISKPIDAKINPNDYLIIPTNNEPKKEDKKALEIANNTLPLNDKDTKVIPSTTENKSMSENVVGTKKNLINQAQKEKEINLVEEKVQTKTLTKKTEKEFKEEELFDQIKKPEELLSKSYLPVLSKDTKGSNDVFSLTDEELQKLNEMDEYLSKKEQYMEKVTKYLDKKQKYFNALKTFDDFNKQMNNEQLEKQQKGLKTEMEEKMKSEVTVLRNEIKQLNATMAQMKTQPVVTEDSKIEQEKIKQTKIEEQKNVHKNDIATFFQKGQIFSMNNEYIVAVESENGETVYKKGEIILGGFIISDVTDSIVTLEKDNQLYFHNIKNSLAKDSYSQVIVQMPAMYSNMDKEDALNDKLAKKANDATKNSKTGKNSTTGVPEYKTPEERKKEEAQIFFNLNDKNKK